MKYQDIQIDDVDLWKKFRQDMDAGEYAKAFFILQNLPTNCAMTAGVLNSLTDSIVTIENLNDPSFKSDRIQLVDILPTSASEGTVYFQRD